MPDGLHELSQAIGVLTESAHQRLRGEQLIFQKLDAIAAAQARLDSDVRLFQAALTNESGKVVLLAAHLKDHCAEFGVLKSYINQAKGASMAVKVIYALVGLIGAGSFSAGVLWLSSNTVEARAKAVEQQIQQLQRRLPQDFYK